MEIIDDRVCVLGESPWYERRTGRVSWVDHPASRVLWRDLNTGDTGEVSTPEPVSAAVPRIGGGLVLCLADGPVLMDPDGTLRVLGSIAEADAAAGLAANSTPIRANDAKADPVGRLFVGTLALDGTAGAAGLYRLDPGSSQLRRVLGGVGVGNGLGWSPDGATMYFVDTAAARVDAFDYDLATGEMTGRRVFADFNAAQPLGGKPDGLSVDSAGGVWVACWGGSQVLRFTADGALERRIALPPVYVTSCAFAGDDLDLLVVTTASRDTPGAPGAGQTFGYRPGDVTGQPVGAYGS
jgi:sugar lactone lactonase YvrE